MKKSLAIIFVCLCFVVLALDVNGLSFVTTSAPNLIFRSGSRVMLNCSVSSTVNGTERVYWTKDDTRLFNTSERVTILPNVALTITSAMLLDSGRYKCEAVSSTATISAISNVIINDVPGKPKYVILYNKRSHSVGIFWTFASGQDHNSRMLSYRIEYKSNHMQTSRTQTVTYSNANNATVQLSPWGTYRFRVAAINAVGVGEYSDWSDAYETPADVPYRAPNMIRAEGSVAQSTSLVISWEGLIDEDQNGPGIGYIIYYNTSNQILRAINATNVYSYVINNLSPRTYYNVYVRAYNSLGLGKVNSSVVLGYTGEAPPKSPPVNFRVIEVGSDYISVRWEAIPNTAVEGVLRGYRLKIWSTENPNNTAAYNASENSRTYTFRRLKAYTQYEIHAFGFNMGTGNYAFARVLQSTQATVPGPVARFSGYQVAGDIYLHWSKPLSPNGFLISYRINITYRLYDSIYRPYGIRYVDSNTHSYTINRVPRGTYNFSIAAETVKGFGDEIRTGITSVGYEYAPYGVIARPLSYNRVNITWLARKNPSQFDVHFKKATENATWYKFYAVTRGELRTVEVFGLENGYDYYFRVLSVQYEGGVTIVSSPTAELFVDMSLSEAYAPWFSRAWFVVLFIIAICLFLVLVCICCRVVRKGPVQVSKGSLERPLGQRGTTRL